MVFTLVLDAFNEEQGIEVHSYNTDVLSYRLKKNDKGYCILFNNMHYQKKCMMVSNADFTEIKTNMSSDDIDNMAFYKMMGLCCRFPQHRSFGHYYMGYLPWDKPAKIEVVSGAFCMIRREALLKVGLLDEDFFMYGEDIDLSYRILKGGYQNYYLPVDILHYKGESTQKSSFRYVHVFYEAMLIFFRKHYSGMSWLISLPIKAAIYAKATLALFQMQIDRARKSLGFITYEWQT